MGNTKRNSRKIRNINMRLQEEKLLFWKLGQYGKDAYLLI